jgi:diguanylate cyclase (GGDEF)-like protein
MTQPEKIDTFPNPISDNLVIEDKRVLVVDDEEHVVNLLARILDSDGYETITAASGDEALAKFKQNPVSIVLTDIRMNGMSGFELLKEIKNINKNTQVIIITSHASTESAMESLRNGAYDYILKPFDNLEIISSAVQRAQDKHSLLMQNEHLIKELSINNFYLKEANLALVEKASRDGLTGLYNHRFFHESLQIELARSKRLKENFSILFMDLDNFKLFNDSCGHIYGDKLLVDIAKILTLNLRECDTIARYGGEEFIALLPKTNIEEALGFAEKIRVEIENHNSDKSKSIVTISSGLASFPGNSLTATTLIELADKALYKAKNSGKNKICIAVPQR